MSRQSPSPAKARRPPIGWGAIWVKAVALACRKWPELRTAYLPFPWPHMYRHPRPVATMVVEREWNGSACVFFDQVKGPDSLSLREIRYEANARCSRPFSNASADATMTRPVHSGRTAK
jgi:hypothetical protein